MRSGAGERPRSDASLRLLIADDNLAMLDSLATALALPDQIAVVATIDAAQDLLPAVDETEPDVVLLDLRLGDDWGFDLVPAIRGKPSSPEVVVLSAMVDERTQAEADRSGTFRQLAKGCPLRDIRRAVVEAARRNPEERGRSRWPDRADG